MFAYSLLCIKNDLWGEVGIYWSKIYEWNKYSIAFERFFGDRLFQLPNSLF
jgi:hypothetical protein